MAIFVADLDSGAGYVDDQVDELGVLVADVIHSVDVQFHIVAVVRLRIHLDGVGKDPLQAVIRRVLVVIHICAGGGCELVLVQLCLIRGVTAIFHEVVVHALDAGVGAVLRPVRDGNGHIDFAILVHIGKAIVVGTQAVVALLGRHRLIARSRGHGNGAGGGIEHHALGGHILIVARLIGDTGVYQEQLLTVHRNRFAAKGALGSEIQVVQGVLIQHLRGVAGLIILHLYRAGEGVLAGGHIGHRLLVIEAEGQRIQQPRPAVLLYGDPAVRGLGGIHSKGFVGNGFAVGINDAVVGIVGLVGVAGLEGVIGVAGKGDVGGKGIGIGAGIGCTGRPVLIGISDGRSAFVHEVPGVGHNSMISVKSRDTIRNGSSGAIAVKVVAAGGNGDRCRSGGGEIGTIQRVPGVILHVDNGLGGVDIQVYHRFFRTAGIIGGGNMHLHIGAVVVLGGNQDLASPVVFQIAIVQELLDRSLRSELGVGTGIPIRHRQSPFCVPEIKQCGGAPGNAILHHPVFHMADTGVVAAVLYGHGDFHIGVIVFCLGDIVGCGGNGGLDVINDDAIGGEINLIARLISNAGVHSSNLTCVDLGSLLVEYLVHQSIFAQGQQRGGAAVLVVLHLQIRGSGQVVLGALHHRSNFIIEPGMEAQGAQQLVPKAGGIADLGTGGVGGIAGELPHRLRDGLIGGQLRHSGCFHIAVSGACLVGILNLPVIAALGGKGYLGGEHALTLLPLCDGGHGGSIIFCLVHQGDAGAVKGGGPVGDGDDGLSLRVVITCLGVAVLLSADLHRHLGGHGVDIQGDFLDDGVARPVGNVHVGRYVVAVVQLGVNGNFHIAAEFHFAAVIINVDSVALGGIVDVAVCRHTIADGGNAGDVGEGSDQRDIAVIVGKALGQCRGNQFALGRCLINNDLQRLAQGNPVPGGAVKQVDGLNGDALGKGQRCLQRIIRAAVDAHAGIAGGGGQRHGSVIGKNGLPLYQSVFNINVSIGVSRSGDVGRCSDLIHSLECHLYIIVGGDVVKDNFRLFLADPVPNGISAVNGHAIHIITIIGSKGDGGTAVILHRGRPGGYRTVFHRLGDGHRVCIGRKGNRHGGICRENCRVALIVFRKNSGLFIIDGHAGHTIARLGLGADSDLCAFCLRHTDRAACGRSDGTMLAASHSDSEELHEGCCNLSVFRDGDFLGISRLGRIREVQAAVATHRSNPVAVVGGNRHCNGFAGLHRGLVHLNGAALHRRSGDGQVLGKGYINGGVRIGGDRAGIAIIRIAGKAGDRGHIPALRGGDDHIHLAASIDGGRSGFVDSDSAAAGDTGANGNCIRLHLHIDDPACRDGGIVHSLRLVAGPGHGVGDVRSRCLYLGRVTVYSSPGRRSDGDFSIVDRF